jgi:hypothetical protein
MTTNEQGDWKVGKRKTKNFHQLPFTNIKKQKPKSNRNREKKRGVRVVSTTILVVSGVGQWGGLVTCSVVGERVWVGADGRTLCIFNDPIFRHFEVGFQGGDIRGRDGQTSAYMVGEKKRRRKGMRKQKGRPTPFASSKIKRDKKIKENTVQRV